MLIDWPYFLTSWKHLSPYFINKFHCVLLSWRPSCSFSENCQTINYGTLSLNAFVSFFQLYNSLAYAIFLLTQHDIKSLMLWTKDCFIFSSLPLLSPCFLRWLPSKNSYVSGIWELVKKKKIINHIDQRGKNIRELHIEITQGSTFSCDRQAIGMINRGGEETLSYKKEVLP